MSDDGKLTDAEWRAFQSIPDQGYSHRAWVDHRIAERIHAAQADAWDEGYGKGSSPYPFVQHNPYREQED